MPITPEEVTAATPYQVVFNHARSSPEQVAKLGEICTLAVLNARLRQLVIASLIEHDAEPDELVIGRIVADLMAGAHLRLGPDGSVVVAYGPDETIPPGHLAELVRLYGRGLLASI